MPVFFLREIPPLDMSEIRCLCALVSGSVCRRRNFPFKGNKSKYGAIPLEFGGLQNVPESCII